MDLSSPHLNWLVEGMDLIKSCFSWYGDQVFSVRPCVPVRETDVPCWVEPQPVGKDSVVNRSSILFMSALVRQTYLLDMHDILGKLDLDW